MLAHRSVLAGDSDFQTQVSVTYDRAGVDFSVTLVGVAAMAALAKRQKYPIEDSQAPLGKRRVELGLVPMVLALYRLLAPTLLLLEQLRQPRCGASSVFGAEARPIAVNSCA